MRAVIEVGANDGRDTQRLYDRFKCNVFTFEPVPELYENLKKKFEANDLIHVNWSAVSYFDSEDIPFNITKTDPSIRARYGASSIYDFKKNLKEDWDRPDFVMGETITVPNTTLSKFIEKNNIIEIPYLHIDAQGADLKVMKSLGRHYKKVQAGVLEASDRINLYNNTGNDKNSIVRWLVDKGFIVTNIKPNDPYHAEVNISFMREEWA